MLNVTPDASKTDDTDSDNEIPTLNCGMFLYSMTLADAMKKSCLKAIVCPPHEASSL